MVTDSGQSADPLRRYIVNKLFCYQTASEDRVLLRLTSLARATLESLFPHRTVAGTQPRTQCEDAVLVGPACFQGTRQIVVALADGIPAVAQQGGDEADMVRTLQGCQSAFNRGSDAVLVQSEC